MMSNVCVGSDVSVSKFQDVVFNSEKYANLNLVFHLLTPYNDFI